MIVKFDSFNRFEYPKLVLCNPGSVFADGLCTNVVGGIPDCEAEEVVFNFNTISELNFRMNYVRDGNAYDPEYVGMIFRAMQNRRLVFMENIGYFMITSVKEGYDNGLHYKDVQAQSIESEIQQKMIPYIEDGTYRFSSDLTNKGLLEIIVEVLPLWTIGHVDNAVASRFRTFEDVDTSLNCLSFFLQNIQDAYECIVVFDIMNRIINVYDQANYVHQSNIFITRDDVVNQLHIAEDAENIYTAISVRGGDDNVSIGSVNPIGGNTIYDFSYYLDWMSTGLANKVQAWADAIQREFDNDDDHSYYRLNLKYYEDLRDASIIKAEISRLETQITMYQRCRDNIVAESGSSSTASMVDKYNTVIIENGGTQIVVMAEIADTIAEIDALIATAEADLDTQNSMLESVNNDIAYVLHGIDQTISQLCIKNYFTSDEYQELANYIFEGDYSDEYIIFTDNMDYTEQFEQMRTLYRRASEQLGKVSQPTQEFDVDAESFLFSKEFEHWSSNLETGCIIDVEIEEGDIASLFLCNITVNYDDHKLTMKFGNRYNRLDPRALFENALGKISKSANTLNYIKDILYPLRNGEFNEMQEALRTSRNLTMGAAIASTGEEVVIDESGYTGRVLLDSGEYDPHQIKITGRNIVFTDDAWETCKVAIGELLFGDGSSVYGINAQAIIGDLIMGNNLRILDNYGNDLLTVVDDKIASQVSESTDGYGERISSLEQTAAGIDIRITEIENAEVDHVVTTTGYRFDQDGLRINKSGEEMTNLLDNTGMRVQRSEEDILVADNTGVNALNLRARQYLIIEKHARFEDYSNGTDTKRTACFYIEEEE